MKESVPIFQKGFSLIEILLVTSLLVVILTIGVPNLFTPLGKEQVNSLAKDISALLSEAQTQALNSETLGQGSTTEFGVHFTTSSYTLFKGSVFNPADSNNFTVNSVNSLLILPNLPCPASPNDCNNIIFTQLRGEVSNFYQAKNSLCLKDTLGNSVLLTINFIGVVNEQTNGC